MNTASIHAAPVRFEPSLRLEVRRGFHCCGLANPMGLTHCPSCGKAASAPMFQDADQVVVTYPVLARLFFWIADGLRALARRFE